MLAIGWSWSIFSLTKSGKTKSWGLSFVSRTRLRKAGERRKRRGRCTIFLIDRGYAFGVGVASSPRDELVSPRRPNLTGGSVPCSACLARPPSFDVSSDQLLIDRYQQFVHETGVRFKNANCSAETNGDGQIYERLSSSIRKAPEDRDGGCLFGCAKKKWRRPRGCGKNKSALAKFAIKSWGWNRLSTSAFDRSRPIGQRRRGCKALRLSFDRGGFRHGRDFRHYFETPKLYWRSDCAGSGGDDKFSLSAHSFVAQTLFEGTAPRHWEIDNCRDEVRRRLWLSRVSARDYRPDQSGAISARESSHRSHGRLRTVNRGEVARDRRGPSSSDLGRVAHCRESQFVIAPAKRLVASWRNSANYSARKWLWLACKFYACHRLRKGCNAKGMNIRKIAAITVLVFSSLAATNVAPSKSELEEMYNKAFREFEANNFPEALKELDAIDARQPDLAESQNLRGVILMRQGIYDKAEAALHEAVRIDPKFWNARFNLAEVPFLKRDWAEARTRFQQLLSSNTSELQGEATQLIQYKILLTYLLQGKENMVDSILAKFELSPDTPAVHYANAAIALQQNKTKEAKDLIAAAEKKFSPQLNKLFAESLYEVGWLQKQPGQTRAALELTTAADRAAKTKAFARSRVEQARQAYQQRDFAAASKFIDDADAADPNQAATLNLRGEILLEQKQFDQAEAEFKKALKADSKFRQAQFNLALVPLKKKDYAAARDRFEALLSKTPGGDKTEGAQLIKFDIYMTWLLEGKDSRAQKLMEQCQFTGDTPALYYAQAAWEFKHNNPTRATDWITSAKKIYSPALNVVFADSFYDLGWMQSPALATSPAPAGEAATALAEAQTESGPAIEPSPIPGAAVAKGKAAEAKAKAAAAAIAGMEATAPKPEEPTASTAVTQSSGAAPGSFAAGSPARPEEIPTSPAPNFSPIVETPVAAARAPASASARSCRGCKTASRGRGIGHASNRACSCACRRSFSRKI